MQILEMNKMMKERLKMTDKIAVHCPTEDDWEKVQEKAFGSVRAWSMDYGRIDGDNEGMDCIGLTTKGCCSKEYYEREDYTILSASDYLAYGLEGWGAKVVIGSKWYSTVHNKIITIKEHILFNGGECVEFHLDGEEPHQRHTWSRASFKSSAIPYNPKEPVIKEHTVPLRVDDRVRVLSDIVYSQMEGETGIINDLMDKHPYITGVCIGGENFAITTEGLELIPTEADITVGSVWEDLDNGKIITVSGFDKVNDPKFACGDSWFKHNLLEYFKLIHRGDGEMVDEKREYTEEDVVVGSIWIRESIEDRIYKVLAIDSMGDPEFEYVGDYRKGQKASWCMSSFLKDLRLKIKQPNEPIKTNKKEKKMKNAEQVLKEGMPMMDRSCGNLGVVKLIDVGTGQVVYKDQNSGKLETTDITKCYKQFVLPKPKPVKKKTK